MKVPSSKAIPVFDDSDPNRYYSKDNPKGSVIVAGSGTHIEVTKSSLLGDELWVSISFK